MATKKVRNKRCSRCGSVLNMSGFCTSYGSRKKLTAICPFGRHRQWCKSGWVGHPSHPELSPEFAEELKCCCDET